MAVRWSMNWGGDKIKCPHCGYTTKVKTDGVIDYLPVRCPDCGAVNVGVETYNEMGYYIGLTPISELEAAGNEDNKPL